MFSSPIFLSYKLRDYFCAFIFSNHNKILKKSFPGNIT